jgi:hypothetical protein
MTVMYFFVGGFGKTNDFFSHILGKLVSIKSDTAVANGKSALGNVCIHDGDRVKG